MHKRYDILVLSNHSQIQHFVLLVISVYAHQQGYQYHRECTKQWQTLHLYGFDFFNNCFSIIYLFVKNNRRKKFFDKFCSLLFCKIIPVVNNNYSELIHKTKSKICLWYGFWKLHHCHWKLTVIAKGLNIVKGLDWNCDFFFFKKTIA